MVKRLERGILLEKDPPLDEPWKSLPNLVVDELGSRQAENVIELFQSSLFCFGDPQEDHDQGNDIEAGIQAECTLYER